MQRLGLKLDDRDMMRANECINDINLGRLHDTPYNGEINCWDTSEITDMSFAFEDQTEFNQRLLFPAIVAAWSLEPNGQLFWPAFSQKRSQPLNQKLDCRE